MTESAELTSPVSVNVTIKVAGPDELDWSDPLTITILAAAKYVMHDYDEVLARKIAQYAVQTMRAKK